MSSRRSTLLLSSFIILSAALLFSFDGTADGLVETANAEGTAFEYTFSSEGILDEASSAQTSSSPNWWLASGGSLTVGSGVGKTIHGDLPASSETRKRYATYSPVSSDNGFHPQNLFQLYAKGQWENTAQEVTVTIDHTNLYNSGNSNAWNGINLISRYQNSNTYYYAGIRMDGKVAIKKKQGGVHYTLVTDDYFPGKYNALTAQSLLPTGKAMRLKLETKTQGNTVVLKLSLDNGSGNLVQVLETTDTKPILGAGTVGLYSDYMDLTLDNYRIAPLAITTNSPVSTPAPRTQQPAPVTPAPVTPAPTVSEPTIPAVTAGVYGLSSNVTLQETGSMNESASQLWWLNSGGYFTVQDGIGKTVQGSLPANDKWRLAYASGNARDTDDGYHPQNLFRLLTRSTYKNVQQEGYFKINDYILSDTDLRAEHNGILFFNRYRDGNNLYYTGIRVDGAAVVKKKVGSTYYTIAYKSGVFPGTYNRNSNPNLIPENTWVGIRSIVKDLAGGKVSIKVFVDKSGNGNWEQVIDMVDDGSSGSVITGAAYAGIRSDYMDLEVKGYKVSEI